MRLICPSCQSEYDVAATAIGAKGRMVRCANCGGEWFQAPEAAAEAPLPLDNTPAIPEPALEEVAPEPAPESVPGAGYRIIEEAPQQHNITYEQTPEIERNFPADEGYVPNQRIDGRDTDGLRASLRDDMDDVEPASGSGLGSFVGGFATSAVLVGLLAAVYVAAPSIVNAVPALETAMNGYTDVVDKGRTVLGVLVGG